MSLDTQTACSRSSLDQNIQHSHKTCSCRGWAMVKAATTLAALLAPATAFQSAPLQTSSRPLSVSNGVRGPLGSNSNTRRWTVTDPDLLLMEVSRSRVRPSKHQETALSESLESLENLFIVSQDLDDPAIDDHIEKPASKRRKQQRSPHGSPAKMQASSLPARKKKHTSVSTKKLPQKSNVQQSAMKVTQEKLSFKLGKETEDVSPDLAGIKGSSTATGVEETEKGGSTDAAPAKGADKKKKARSRSSTMPGFSTRHLTGRQKAFNDGIKIVEQRTGKKLSNLVNDPEAAKKRKSASGEAMYKSSASVPDSLVQFAREIHNVERITPSEEIELGTKTQEAIRLQSLKDNLEKSLDREPTDQEWCAAAGKINMEAIRQAIEDGLEAKDRLVTSNLRMVQGVVNIYIRNGLGGEYNAGDMMQEGIIALMRAAEKFEPERGFRFSTYAMYWIRAAVKRSHIFQSRIVNVPQRLHDNHKRVMRTKKELKVTLGREPTRKELCEAVGMSEQQLERCLKAMAQRCVSLDQQVSNKRQPNSDDSQNTMYELVDSKFDDGEYNQVQRLFMREDLIETLYRHLKPHEVTMLLLRFGLMDERTAPYGFSGPLTIAEVSQLVGLKPDKCRRMINSSLKQLKYLIANEWDDFEKEIP